MESTLALNAIWCSVSSYIYGSIYIHHHYVVTKIADHIEKGRGHDRILVAMMPVFSNCTELWCDKVQIFWEDHKNLQLFFDNSKLFFKKREIFLNFVAFSKTSKVQISYVFLNKSYVLYWKGEIHKFKWYTYSLTKTGT